MKRIHFISGLVMTIFISFHLMNHLVSIGGAEAHINLMDKLRIVYRNPIIETMLFAVVMIQLVTGLRLFFTTRKWKTAFYEKLQIWSGLYLAFFLLIHVGAILVGRNVLQLDTNFYFGVAGLNTFPLNVFFIPYYSFAIIAFFGHIASIHAQKMKKKLLGFTAHQQANFILIKAVVLCLIIMYGLTDKFAGVAIPEEYQIMLF